jgi:CheY-like chemotaxis protein
VFACWSTTTRSDSPYRSDTDELMVVAGGNGVDALLLVASTEPDVVLMDIRMPTMMGSR